jgi:thiol-disulfide isomerase/thioredoxin
MKRRTIVGAGLATVAVAAGMTSALWRGQSQHLANAQTALWQLQFDTPQGTSLTLTSLRGNPLLLNFWATWCAPCVRELPTLDEFQRKHQTDGWHVVGLAVDNLNAIQKFLATRKFSMHIGLAGVGGIELARNLGNTTGGLPFTVVFNSAGESVHRKLGALDATDLQSWVKT